MSPPLSPTRRAFALSTTLLAALGSARSALAAPAPERVEIEVSTRKVPLYVWRADTRAAVVFSHGAGADPRGYHPLFDQWTAAGISVVAPVHVDSEINPDQDKYTLASAFVPRWRDVTASVAYARTAFPGVKTGATGHSYGSLFALMMAGALPAVLGPPKTPVDAVVAFSSPGKISLIRPDSYAQVTAPLLQITGDHDLVQGMVSDWHDHLYAYETSAPGDKYAWIGKGVDHNFDGALHAGASAQTSAFAEASGLSTQFLRTYLEDDREARTALAARGDTALAHFSRR